MIQNQTQKHTPKTPSANGTCNNPQKFKPVGHWLSEPTPFMRKCHPNQHYINNRWSVISFLAPRVIHPFPSWHLSRVSTALQPWESYPRDPGSPSENGFMEPKYYAFRFGDCTPQSSAEKVIGSLGSNKKNTTPVAELLQFQVAHLHYPSLTLRSLVTWREFFGRKWKEMGVSKNNGTPKSSILIGCFIINHPFWGTPIFGNIQMNFVTCISFCIHATRHWGILQKGVSGFKDSPKGSVFVCCLNWIMYVKCVVWGVQHKDLES